MPPLPSPNHNVVPNLKLETLLASLRQLSPVAQKASILWPGIGSLGSPPSHASDIRWKSSRLHSVDFLASSLALVSVIRPDGCATPGSLDGSPPSSETSW